MLHIYNISYKTVNHYELGTKGAIWQFLVLPETNSTQNIQSAKFSNSENETVEQSINGYGFSTYKIQSKKLISEISFSGTFVLTKQQVNPIKELVTSNSKETFECLQRLDFKTDFEPFLRETPLTYLPDDNRDYFTLNESISIFQNLQQLNEKVFKTIHFKTNITNVNTSVSDVLKIKAGVCQDFTHLFCAVARKNGIPSRYISGYLHQGKGYFGDSQMHAWAEAYIPHMGWVGFDPTNNILADHNHIKVCHGKDYNDCSPLKGIVFSSGTNDTKYQVSVHSDQ
ncbi:transglutaminase-like domain-containing protein [Ascidiimonas sp. W6]|uniref:transglutaminase-like domain-containing protein n=1 Tax=Ascidiimonas meishanensis TaxID=3128903 RepID=UPI0030EE4409